MSEEPAPVEPVAPVCADCGVSLNEGEAKCFTVCDDCWRKAYPPPPEPAPASPALKVTSATESVGDLDTTGPLMRAPFSAPASPEESQDDDDDQERCSECGTAVGYGRSVCDNCLRAACERLKGKADPAPAAAPVRLSLSEIQRTFNVNVHAALRMQAVLDSMYAEHARLAAENQLLHAAVASWQESTKARSDDNARLAQENERNRQGFEFHAGRGDRERERAEKAEQEASRLAQELAEAKQAFDNGQANEHATAARLSEILTNGGASTWDEIERAAEAAVSRAQEAEQQHAESLAAYGEVLGDLEAARSALAQAEQERDEWHRLHRSMAQTAGEAIKERDELRAALDDLNRKYQKALADWSKLEMGIREQRAEIDELRAALARIVAMDPTYATVVGMQEIAREALK